MSDENYPIRLVSPTHGETDGTFILNEDDEGEDHTLKLQFLDREITGAGTDYFDAMCQIRAAIESDGWRLICYGASRSAYPSVMAREMGQGLKAYKLQLGHQARSTDLVSIFSAGPDVEPASVAEQAAFWQQWLRSLGTNP